MSTLYVLVMQSLAKISTLQCYMYEKLNVLIPQLVDIMTVGLLGDHEANVEHTTALHQVSAGTTPCIIVPAICFHLYIHIILWQTLRVIISCSCINSR